MSLSYEFPGHPPFPDEIQALLSEGCWDSSWHNDICPSITIRWIADEPSGTNTYRFSLPGGGYETRTVPIHDEIQLRLWDNSHHPECADYHPPGGCGDCSYNFAVNLHADSSDDWDRLTEILDWPEEIEVGVETLDVREAVAAFVRAAGLITRAYGPPTKEG